jgi:hypothetical protein
MEPGSSREAAKNRVIAAGNAQAVFNRLGEIENDRTANINRWAWELLQNARDAADKATTVSVSVAFDGTTLQFQHNGPPFRDEEIAHLIFHGSTKHDEHAGIGRFGTGFISTHLLSRVVRVSGPLDDGNVFDFPLDRTGLDAAALEASMRRSWDAMNESLRPAQSQESDRLTTFEYPIEPEAKNVVVQGLENLSAIAPLILAFNNPFVSLSLTLNGIATVYRLQNRKELGGHIWSLQVADEQGKATSTVLLSARDDVQVAIVLTDTADGQLIRPKPGMSRIYVAFPLSSTADYPMRVAVNSEKFNPLTERDGIYLVTDDSPKNSENRTRFELACQLFGELIEHIAQNDIAPVTELLTLSKPVGLKSVDLEYLARVIRERVVNDVAGRSVVPSHDGPLLSLRQSVIPLAEVGKRVPLWKCLAAIKDIRAALPRQEDIDGWNDVITSWSHFSAEPSENTDGVWTIENLVDYVAECRSLAVLTKYLDGDPFEWLSSLLDLLQADGKFGLVAKNAILPNQHGELKSVLLLDEGIPAELKDLAEELELTGRGELLAPNLSECCYSSQLDGRTADDLFDAILEELGDLDESHRSVAVRLFAFVVQTKRRNWLDRIPIITAGTNFNTSQITLRAAAKDRLLVPIARWPETARSFGELFPSIFVLHDDYAGEIPADEDWKWLVDQGAVISSPLVMDTALVEDFVELMRKGPETEDVRSKEKPARSHVAYLSGEVSVLERVRSSRRLGVLLVRYLLEAVVPGDPEAFTEIEVLCEDDSSRRCYRGAWIAPLLNRGWVKSEKRATYLTAESLADLLADEAAIVKVLLQESNLSLLKSFGISPADLALRSVGKTESDRMSLIRSLGVIADAIGPDPEQVARFAATIKADAGLLDYIAQRGAFIDRIERNQTFGFAVEREFTNAFTPESGVHIKRTGHGHDFSLTPVVGEEDDAGRLEVTAGDHTAYVELKATRRSDAVRMSVRQVESATSMPNRYWLCVVVIEDGEVTSELVQSQSRFVCDIGTQLAEAWADYGSLREATPSAAESDSEAALEVTDQEVKFRIGKKLWERGISFTEAMTRLRSNMALATSDARTSEFVSPGETP